MRLIDIQYLHNCSVINKLCSIRQLWLRYVSNQINLLRLGIQTSLIDIFPNLFFGTCYPWDCIQNQILYYSAYNGTETGSGSDVIFSDNEPNGNTVSISANSQEPLIFVQTPLPGALVLFVSGLALLGIIRRKGKELILINTVINDGVGANGNAVRFLP